MSEQEIQKIIACAPHRFTDRDELRLAMRETIISGDTQRRTALQERDDVLREEWGAQNPEKVAALERVRQEEIELFNYGDQDSEKTDPKESARIIMLLRRKSARDSNHELEMLIERDIAKAKAEQLKNRFGLPHGQEDFCPREIHEIAKKNGYEAKYRALLDALAKRGDGEGKRLSFTETEEFLSVLLSKQRRKRAP